MFERIKPEDLAGKGVIGLPDTPKLTTGEMQKKFEETARDVIIPNFNALAEQLEAPAAAAQIGATNAVGAESTVQQEIERLRSGLKNAENNVKIANENAEDAVEAAGEAVSLAKTGIAGHNTNTNAHADLRMELKALADRINAALDSDDTTLDELSEIVAYIKSNKSLIDAVTISKVNVSDIVNNLVTNVVNKPLSAAQGVVLKELIDKVEETAKGLDITEFQELSDEQRTAARVNISAVSYEANQGLNDFARYNARTNIKAVSYEASPQTSLTEEEKAQARKNIGAAAKGETGAENAVTYTEQTLTESEKVQARENIGAAPASHVDNSGRYGMASASLYGHVLLVNNADKDSAGNGRAVTPYALWKETDNRVSVEAQELTDEQKAQARSNIDALGTAQLPAAVDNALAQAKASGEFDGEKGDDGAPGKDGVSATHKWEGTTLTITSASGTSSANLKGDKGDTGAQGAKGADGQPGKDGAAGKDGADGKSAYQYAVDAGYTGTEEEFAKVLASGGYAPETETVLSDNLLDKSLMTKGQVFYYGGSGYQLVASTYSYYGFIPLRGAGTYRTKFQQQVHESTGTRIALVNDNNTWVANTTGTCGEIVEDKNWVDFEFVVTQEHISAGATKVAFDVYSGANNGLFNKTMIVKDREYPSEYIPFGYIEVATDSGKKQNNVLCEKTAVFLGDSICAGTTVGTDSPYYNYGWGGIIGEANRMNWKNYGKNGGTITHRGADGTCIAKIADTAIAEHPNADYVIFEGGCNDADQMKDAGLGVVSSDYATFDTTTFSGALEALILKLVTAYPNAKIGYIIPQKMYTGYADFTAKNHIHRKYFDRAVEICQKWGIPVVDIWNGSMLNPKLSTASVYYSDGIQHLSEAGYLAITPMIEAWMRNMYVPGTAAGGSGGVTSWNDLPDKPFGDMVEVYPETAFSYVESLGFFVSPDAFPSSLIAGYDYVIRYNGVDYPCTAFDAVFSNMAIVAVGNASATGGENNGLPFVVAYMDGALGALPLDGSTSVTVGVKAPKKLHAQYVPTQVPYVYERCFKDFSVNGDYYNYSDPELPLALLEAVYQRRPIYIKVLAQDGAGTYTGVEHIGLASVSCCYKVVAIGLGLADKTSEIFKIPEGTVVNGTEVTTAACLLQMGVCIGARMFDNVNSASDYHVWFIDSEGLD